MSQADAPLSLCMLTVLAQRASECDLIWAQGCCRYNLLRWSHRGSLFRHDLCHYTSEKSVTHARRTSRGGKSKGLHPRNAKAFQHTPRSHTKTWDKSWDKFLQSPEAIDPASTFTGDFWFKELRDDTFLSCYRHRVSGTLYDRLTHKSQWVKWLIPSLDSAKGKIH